MKIAVQGSYPKIPAGSGASVRTQIQRFDRGLGSPKDLERSYREVTARVLNLAEDVGLDLTTDGQIRCNDWFDPIVRDIDNVYSEGLLRLFDNNFYYRHPVIRGRLAFQGGTLRYWTEQATEISKVPVKVAMPGPFTFLALSEDQSYHDDDRLLRDLLAVLKMQRESLAGIGAVEVQWDEPSLARDASLDPVRVREVFHELLAESSIAQSVALFWGSRSHRWLEPLADLPLTTVYCDAVVDPNVFSALASTKWPFTVGIGALDARNVRLEDPADLARQLEPILHRQSSDRVILHPSSGLELLPPDRAEAKVRRLAEVRAAVLGTVKS
ncbi:MAG: synthase [Firmicutes bacterium]|jgi:5-methyltetrahydropteroyltriglutamate--homocysteine methyltransferase|nr:synthase [Bacillota bacterium]